MGGTIMYTVYIADWQCTAEMCMYHRLCMYIVYSTCMHVPATMTATTRLLYVLVETVPQVQVHKMDE